MGDDPIPQNDPDKASRQLFVFFGSFIFGPLLILGSGALSIILGFAGMMSSLAKSRRGANEMSSDIENMPSTQSERTVE